MAVHRRRKGGGTLTPPQTKMTITMGKMLSGHFWYTNFWVPLLGGLCTLCACWCPGCPLCRNVAPRGFGRFADGIAIFPQFSVIFPQFSHNFPAIFPQFSRNFSQLDLTLPAPPCVAYSPSVVFSRGPGQSPVYSSPQSSPEGPPSRCLDPTISVSPSAVGCGGQDITLRSAPRSLPPPTRSLSHCRAAVHPPARRSHTAVACGDKMYVFGGFSRTPGKTNLGDLWEFHLPQEDWKELTPRQVMGPCSGAWQGRAGRPASPWATRVWWGVGACGVDR